MPDARVDPFLFVAATRYAIHRWLTSASELVARQVIAHADVVCADAGARSAILDEISDLLRESPGQTLGYRSEWDANRRRWQEVAEVLRRGPAASGDDA